MVPSFALWIQLLEAIVGYSGNRHCTFCSANCFKTTKFLLLVACAAFVSPASPRPSFAEQQAQTDPWTVLPEDRARLSRSAHESHFCSLVSIVLRTLTPSILPSTSTRSFLWQWRSMSALALATIFPLRQWRRILQSPGALRPDLWCQLLSQ